MTNHALRLCEQLFLPRKSDNSGGDDLFSFLSVHLNLRQKSDLSGCDDLFFGLHSNLRPKIMVFLAPFPHKRFYNSSTGCGCVINALFLYSRLIVVACMQAYS